MVAGMPSNAERATGSASWIEKLFVSLRRRRLPLIQILAVDDSIDAVLNGGLVVEFRPLVEGARCYRSTKRFNVSYTGARELSPAHLEAVNTLIETIERIETRLPAAWPGVTVTGELEESPSRAFARRFRFAQLDRSHGEAGVETEILARLTSVCNQQCPFCSGPPVEKPSAESLHACIDWVATHIPRARFTITGGEPTLCPFFFDVLRHALERPELSGVLVYRPMPSASPRRPGRPSCRTMAA